MMNQEQHDREEKEIKGRLQEIGRMIKGELPTGWAFTMLVAAIGDIKGVTLYISTMNRADALQIMREFIAAQREARNWFQDVKLEELDTHEEFKEFWTEQLKRGVEDWTMEQACKEAFEAGRASA